MAIKSNIADKELLVTFQSIDLNEHSIAVIRKATGRNGQTRNIKLVLRFNDDLAFRRFVDCLDQGDISAGDEVLLKLRQEWNESRSDTSVIEFTPCAKGIPIPQWEVAAR